MSVLWGLFDAGRYRVVHSGRAQVGQAETDLQSVDAFHLASLKALVLKTSETAPGIVKSPYVSHSETPRHDINSVNPFTPVSDQCQNSPAASQEIWHHTVWRTWLFIAYSDEKWLYYKFSLHHSYNRFLKGWENTLFELRSERVNKFQLFWQNCATNTLSITRKPHVTLLWKKRKKLGQYTSTCTVRS